MSFSPVSPTNGQRSSLIVSEVEKLEAIPNPPATDLIKELLKFHKGDSKHKRNTGLSTLVFKRSHAVYQEINHLVEIVDRSPKPDFTCWESYTAAIPPLEDILLHFYFNQPTKFRKHVPDDVVDIQAGITFIHLWSEDRAMLKAVLTKLSNSNQFGLSDTLRALLTASYEEKRYEDDSATIQALYDYIATMSAKLKDQDIKDRGSETPVTDIRNICQSIYQKLKTRQTEAVYDIAIRTFMIFAVILALIEVRRSSKPDEKPQGPGGLCGWKVWSPLKILFQIIIIIIEAKPGPGRDGEVKKGESAIDVLLKILLEICGKPEPPTVSCVNELFELIKLSAKIRSPFHERTVGLVKILRFLDEQSLKSGATDNARLVLQDVMTDAIRQLKENAKVNTDVKAILLSGPLYKTQAEAMNQLLLKVQNTSTTLSLSNQWPRAEQFFVKGVETDEDHLRRMRSIFMNLSS